MISFDEIIKHYPANLHRFERFIIREYLQHKILQIVFGSRYANSLAFLGGTCLRIVHGNQRFSEDLDFDNFGLTENEFSDIALIIQKELEREGYEVEIKTVLKSAFHCHVKFPELLYRQGLSSHKSEKILIQLDTEAQHFSFTPEKFILNKFDVFTQINITPLPLLLAQKLYAILNRKRNKGRDFFDVVFLLSLTTQPDYQYLEQKTGIASSKLLKEKLLQKCASLDMQKMADDVAPFLFNAADEKKIKLFAEYVKQQRFG